MWRGSRQHGPATEAGQRMPVSTGTVTWVNPVAPTVTGTGLEAWIESGAGTASTEYRPGATGIRKFPSEAEGPLATSEPSGSSTRTVVSTGLGGQGLPSTITGHDGPANTRPRIPVAPEPPDPSEPHAPRTTVAHRTNATYRAEEGIIPV
jgi:hypothetical protein